MKFAEALNLASELAQLFPNAQINTVQARRIANSLKEFEPVDVRRAFDDHHRRFEFVNYPELYKACRERPAPTANPVRQAFPDESTADIYRKQNPQLAGRSDVEVILRVHRGWWWAVAERPEASRESYRRGFLSSCIHNLWGLKLHGAVIEESKARELSETISWQPDEFRTVLADLRGELELSHAHN